MFQFDELISERAIDDLLQHVLQDGMAKMRKWKLASLYNQQTAFSLKVRRDLRERWKALHDKGRKFPILKMLELQGDIIFVSDHHFFPDDE